MPGRGDHPVDLGVAARGHEPAGRRGAPDQMGVEQGAALAQHVVADVGVQLDACASPPRRRRAPPPAGPGRGPAPRPAPSGWWPSRARARPPRRHRRSARRAGRWPGRACLPSPRGPGRRRCTPARAGPGRGRRAGSGGRRRSGSPCRSGCARHWCGAARDTRPARGPPSPSARWPRRPAPRGRWPRGTSRPAPRCRCTR